MRNFIRDEHIGSVSLLQDRILHDPTWLERFVYKLSVNVSAMFRDPQFYLAFRQEVVRKAMVAFKAGEKFTLDNHSRLHEAIEQYRKALAIRPYPLAEEQLRQTVLLRDAARR